jgi:hypothetical protein
MASPSPFDASPLWWPPAARLHEMLARAAVDPSPAAADGLATALRERRPWLVAGLATFKPPSPGSRAALEGDLASLSLGGGKKIPVDAALVGDALELSAVAASFLPFGGGGGDWKKKCWGREEVADPRRADFPSPGGARICAAGHASWRADCGW